MTCAIIANDRQIAAIIAGLRLIERELPNADYLPQGVSEILDAGETIQPLSEIEIDDLCDSLAMTEPTFVIVQTTDDGFTFFGPNGWGEVSTATQHTFEEMLTAHLPAGSDPRWAQVSDLAKPPLSAAFQTQEQIDALGAPALYGPASHQFQHLRNSLPHAVS